MRACFFIWISKQTAIIGSYKREAVFHFLAVQVIFFCVYVTKYLHFITMFLSL